MPREAEIYTEQKLNFQKVALSLYHYGNDMWYILRWYILRQQHSCHRVDDRV